MRAAAFANRVRRISAHALKPLRAEPTAYGAALFGPPYVSDGTCVQTVLLTATWAVGRIAVDGAARAERWRAQMCVEEATPACARRCRAGYLARRGSSGSGGAAPGLGGGEGLHKDKEKEDE